MSRRIKKDLHLFFQRMNRTNGPKKIEGEYQITPLIGDLNSPL